jgi:hypothetical protein
MRDAAGVAAIVATLLLAAPPVAAAPARWHFVFGKTWEISIFFEREERGDATRLLVKAPAGRFVFLSSQDPSVRDSTESIRPPDPCVVFTAAGGSVASGLGAFAGSQAGPLRGRIAGLVSPGMRDALFALAPILPAVAEFGSYGNDFLGLVWPDRFGKKQDLRRGERKPGCAFDADFGFPCSDEEKAREAKRFAEPAR